MNNKSRFLSVNWMQGMSVSSSHFIDTENYLLERILQNMSLVQGSFMYGLLPETNDQSSLSLLLRGVGNRSILVLESFRCLLPGGCLLLLDDLGESVSCPCETEGEVSEEGWDVVLSVSPFDRNPCGTPDLQETPPRYPFVEPTYKLGIVARTKKEPNKYGPYAVVIGLLRKKESTYVLDSNYIPPSLTMSSQCELQSYMDSFSSRISVINETVGIVMEKAMSQSNRSQIMDCVLLVCKELKRNISSFYFHWRNNAYNLSPYQITEILSGLANAVLTSFSFLPKKDKEEMLKYFYEWNGVSPSSFEQMLEEVVNKPYNHNRIRQSLLGVDGVIQTLEELFVSLSHLDFVGQHKENIVISVSEKQKATSVTNSSSWLVVD
ncbi:MAG: hypothetical protein M0P12_12985 [Paludibacteraceae bacterium]|nr:hypothetical protein [Paludibacteraceae bacterium]